MKIKDLIPREHGAWAILLLPYFIGVAIGDGLSLNAILGLVSMLFLFLSRQPFLSLLKSRTLPSSPSRIQKKTFWLGFLLFVVPGGGIFLWLAIGQRLLELIFIGLLGVLLSLLHLYLTLKRKERALMAEVIGVGLLTLTAPLGIIIAGRRTLGSAFILWLLNICYFSGSIFYIKMRKKAVLMRNASLSFPKNFHLVKECLAYLLVLAVIISLLTLTQSVSLWVCLAFLPMVAHTLWSVIALRPSFEILKQGLIQTQLSLIYALLLILFWR